MLKRVVVNKVRELLGEAKLRVGDQEEGLILNTRGG